MNREDDDDKHLFRRAMQGITPLNSRTRPTVRPPRRSADDIHTACKPPLLSNPLELDSQAETLLHYGQERIAFNQFQRLKRGTIPIQSRLDLHGQTVTIAREQLADFILKNHKMGVRCLLIIHGKGAKHGPYSRLKSHVNHWLKQMPEVLAFHSAESRHGGRGAVYVLLKAVGFK